MELAAHMRHAGGLDDLVAVELLVTTIAIGMHHTAELCEMVGRMRALAVGAIVVGNGSGSGIFVAATIEDVDPDPAGFGPSSPWVENIDRGIIRMYSLDRCDMRSNQQDERRKRAGAEVHAGRRQSIPSTRRFRFGRRELLSPGVYLLRKNVVPARHTRNAAIRTERFLQYRKLQFCGPSTLSLGTRQDLNLGHSYPVTSQMNHLCRNLR